MSLRLLTLVALLAPAAGCYSHVYHVRKPSHDFGEVAIDRNKPHSGVKWGTWWGVGYVWEPIGCVYEDGSTHIVAGREEDDNCKSYYPLCESGVGRVEVQPVFYAIPLTVLTLGALYAADITAYCSTESTPDGPSGPDGPTGPDEEDGATHARAIH